MNQTHMDMLHLAFSWHAETVSVPVAELPALSAASVCEARLCDTHFCVA